MKATLTALLFAVLLPPLAHADKPFKCIDGNLPDSSWSDAVEFTNWFTHGLQPQAKVTLQERGHPRELTGSCEYGSYVFGTKVFVDCVVEDSLRQDTYDTVLFQPENGDLQAILLRRDPSHRDKKTVYRGDIGNLRKCDIVP